MLLHDPQPPFACSLCDHVATKMAALVAHVKKHLFLYACCACDRQLVSSRRLRSHLEECHPELDQEPAFVHSINVSYCLIPPEGGGGSEETQRRAMEEQEEGEDEKSEAGGNKERGDEEQTMTEQDKLLEGGGEVQEAVGASENGAELRSRGAQGSSQNRCKEAEAEETLITCSSTAGDTRSSSSPETAHSLLQEDAIQEDMSTENNTSSSLGNTTSELSKDAPSSSGPQVDYRHILPSEKVKLKTKY